MRRSIFREEDEDSPRTETPLTSSRVPPPSQPPASPVSVAAALDRSIEPFVSELHDAPVARKLREGTLAKEEYCDLVQALLLFHRSFDRALAQARHLIGFDAPPFRREEILLRDLRNLGGRLPVRAPAFLDQIERLLPGWSGAPSVAFVGALYVLERERLQSLKFLPLLARGLRIRVAPRIGLDYWLEHSGQASRRCHALVTWIDTHVVDRERTKELVAGAVQTLRVLGTVHGRAAEPTA